MSDTPRKPQPRESVLKISTVVYWRFVKVWFWHRSPATHTWGWHSYISMRLMHSESMPQGFSSEALQLQRGISERSAVMICTFPIGRFTWETEASFYQHISVKRFKVSLQVCFVTHSTLMCLYGGGFLSFFLSSWSCLISFSIWSSLNLSAASVRAMDTGMIFTQTIKA